MDAQSEEPYALEGFVDCIRDGIAYISLRHENGEEFCGEYEAAKLEQLGIGERQRFKCFTVLNGTEWDVVIEAIPRIELSKERLEEIEREIQEVLGDCSVFEADY